VDIHIRTRGPKLHGLSKSLSNTPTLSILSAKPREGGGLCYLLGRAWESSRGRESSILRSWPLFEVKVQRSPEEYKCRASPLGTLFVSYICTIRAIQYITITKTNIAKARSTSLPKYYQIFGNCAHRQVNDLLCLWSQGLFPALFR
jgi:hypothetical protein